LSPRRARMRGSVWTAVCGIEPKPVTRRRSRTSKTSTRRTGTRMTRECKRAPVESGGHVLANEELVLGLELLTMMMIQSFLEPGLRLALSCSVERV